MARYDLNYKPWQRKMVDPNHPGGAVKYGVYPASPAGENMLMGGLAGSLLPLLPLRSIPSVYKPLGRVLPRARITPQMGVRPPGAIRPRRDWARPLMRPGARRIPDDLALGYKPQSKWPRWSPTGERMHPRITPADLNRIMGRRVDQSLSGVRPYRGPRGIGLYKGTRTGPLDPPPRGGGNPIHRMRDWWRLNNPWM